MNGKVSWITIFDCIEILASFDVQNLYHIWWIAKSSSIIFWLSKHTMIKTSLLVTSICDLLLKFLEKWTKGTFVNLSIYYDSNTF